MLPLLRSRRLVWIALIAWTAQWFLPAAHASMMARQQAGLATWCGAFSPEMTRQLAALAPEVRRILEAGSAQSAQHDDCAKLCTTAAGGVLPTVAPTVSLRAAGLEPLPAAPVVRAHHAYARSRPARGPPTSS